jgi:2-isopropylmalate synthase
VIIFDTTLRDGIMGLPIPSESTPALFPLIDDLGVDVIEFGLVNRKTGDLEPLRRARASIARAEACCIAFPDPDTIERAAETLGGRDGGRLHVFNSAAPDPAREEERLRDIRDTVSKAAAHCGHVQWGAVDAPKSQPDFLCRAVEAAVAAGARTINLADTRGLARPEDMAAMVTDLLQRVPNIGKAAIAVHCHNDIGLAVENSLAGLHAGAIQVECTVDGIGPRGGNTGLRDIVDAGPTDFFPDFKIGALPVAEIAVRSLLARAGGP